MSVCGSLRARQKIRELILGITPFTASSYHILFMIYIYCTFTFLIYLFIKQTYTEKCFFLLYSTVSRDFWTKNRYKYFKIKQNSHVLYTVSCFLMHLHSTYLTIRSIFGRLKTHCTASFWARHT